MVRERLRAALKPWGSKTRGPKRGARGGSEAGAQRLRGKERKRMMKRARIPKDREPRNNSQGRIRAASAPAPIRRAKRARPGRPARTGRAVRRGRRRSLSPPGSRWRALFPGR
jgi:hypothetical protein